MAVRAEGWKSSGLVKGLGIPAPSGPRLVGCVDLMHRLEGREDSLLVRLFYPAAADARGEYAKWTPLRRYTKAYLDFFKTRASGLIAAFADLFTGPRVPALYGVRLGMTPPQDTPANGDTQPSSGGDEGVNDQSTNQRPPMPVIIFSHGLGSMRTTYSGICCDLSSHGYIVASVEHRDRSACTSMRRIPRAASREGEEVQYQDDWLEFYHRPETEKEFPLRNRQVCQRAADMKEALDLMTLLNEGGTIHNMMDENFDFKQFQGSMDLSQVAVMGHSFGGATTVQTLSEDSRFKCGIALDTWMVPIHRDVYGTGIQQPLLFINSHDFQWVENVQQMMKLAKPPDDNGISSCQVLTLRDTTHISQTDAIFVTPPFAARWTTWGQSRLDPNIAHAINQEICHAFLRRYLLKDSAYQQCVPNLDGGDGHSEHIIFGTNLDLTKSSDSESGGEGQGEGVVEPTNGIVEDNTSHDDSQQAKL